MKTAKLAVAIVLLMIATPLCAVDAEPATDFSDDAKPLKTTICGYVGDVSNLEKNIPLQNVVVKLMDEKRQLIGTYATDSDGYFEFTYSESSGAFLSFNLEGYTVRTQPIELTRVEGEVNVLYFDHNAVIENITPDEDGKYQITSNVEGGSFVGMGITTAIISGYVTNEQGDHINNAKVELKTADGQNISGYTNGDGYFEIECFFGSYTLTVTCSGFITSEPIEVSTDNKSIDVVLEEKSHTIFFGLDTPHAWEFMSLVFMTLTILLFIGINYRVKKGKSEIALVNDLELEPEDEEKE